MKRFSLLKSEKSGRHYRNRADAGIRLANVLRHYARKGAVVLGLPRGGVAVAAEIAKALKAPLGVVLVRKIPHPNTPEYAIGAVAANQDAFYNQSEIAFIDKSWLQRQETAERDLIKKRQALYYGDRKPPDIRHKIVILADDGIATGFTMEAAVRAVRKQQPAKVVVAVPVAPQDSIDRLERLCDEVIVLDNPGDFMGAVGSHYLEFDQVDDEEVVTLLQEVYDDIRQTAAPRSGPA